MENNENLMVMENNINNELLAEMKKQNRFAKIQCILTAVLICFCVGIIFIATSLAGDIQTAAKDLGIILAGVDIESLNTAIAELASLDLSGLNTAIAELATLDLETLNQSIANFESFDFATLNKAIKDLSTVIEPLAQFTSFWG